MSLSVVTGIQTSGNYAIGSTLLTDQVPDFTISFGESNIFTYNVEFKPSVYQVNIKRANSKGTVISKSDSFTLTRVTTFSRFMLVLVDDNIQVYVNDGSNWDIINNVTCSNISLLNQVDYPNQGDPFNNPAFFTQYQTVSEFLTFENQTSSLGIASWIQNVGATPTINSPKQVALCSAPSSSGLPSSTTISLAVLIPIAVLFIILFAIYCSWYEELKAILYSGKPRTNIEPF